MGLTYADAGVNIQQKNKSIRTVVSKIQETFKNRQDKIGEVVPSIGHFANYVKIGGSFYALCTDGVGTKVLVAQMMDRYDTIAIDMIAMNVNDIICVGAEPIALVDYLAFESYNEKIPREISLGLVEGARQAGIAIIGGETATLKGVVTGINGRGFDLAGTCFGIVDADAVITGDAIIPGDSIVGLASSGIHSNGLSLARKALLESSSAHDILYEDRRIGDELLVPTRIYVKPVLEMLKANRDAIHGLYHITGSGFMKFNRLKKDVGFRITRLLPVPRVFREIQERGGISDREMFKTFNMGLGFAVITSEPDLMLTIAEAQGIPADVIGVVDDSRKITIEEKGITYSMEGRA